MQDQRIPRTSTGAARPDAVRAYSVMNTLRALEQLALAPHSAPELADRLQISVRTARRLLQRLAAEGYAIQDAGHRRRYRSTLRLAALGRQLVEHAALARAAAPRIADLASATSCPAHLWIAAGQDAICVIHAEHTHPALTQIAREPAAAAQAVLAAERRHVRSYTYIADGDTTTIAAAILDHGEVTAAIGITGPCPVTTLAPVAHAAAALTQTLAGMTILQRSSSATDDNPSQRGALFRRTSP